MLSSTLFFSYIATQLYCYAVILLRSYIRYASDIFSRWLKDADKIYKEDSYFIDNT